MTIRYKKTCKYCKNDFTPSSKFSRVCPECLKRNKKKAKKRIISNN